MIGKMRVDRNSYGFASGFRVNAGRSLFVGSVEAISMSVTKGVPGPALNGLKYRA